MDFEVNKLVQVISKTELKVGRLIGIHSIHWKDSGKDILNIDLGDEIWSIPREFVADYEDHLKLTHPI